MNIFGAMYDKTMQWSKHRFAVFWLSFVSFIEAIFFPIPPDVMLIPMSMSNRKVHFVCALYSGRFCSGGNDWLCYWLLCL